MTAPRPEITPEMTVGNLLLHYPHLETVLISLSPEFRRLQNPVLRRTVAKIAVLRQVATVGGIPVGEMINTLRGAAGSDDQPPCGAPEATAGLQGSPVMDPERPEWAAAPPSIRFDAGPLIEEGGHPLPKVMNDLSGMAEGEVYELLTPFVPAPLLDVVRTKGFRVWVAPREPGSPVRSFFTRNAPESPST